MFVFFVEASDFIADPESVAMFSSMGFTEAQAVKALKATNNNLERAGDLIFSHSAELDVDQPMETASNPPAETFRNGNSGEIRNGTEYRLSTHRKIWKFCLGNHNFKMQVKIREVNHSLLKIFL